MPNAISPLTDPFQLFLDLPEWAVAELQQLPDCFPSLESRMTTVIRFARLNFLRQSGGPFAAGIFERDSGRMVVIGVNRVLPKNCSSAHAEIMALSLAQRHLGSYDLGAPNFPAYQLVVNWRPCTMCFGAVLWSGIRSLVIAGAGPEMEQITGFDEGPMPAEWRKELAHRDIEFIEDVLRDEALADFRAYAASQPFVYNARQGNVA